MSGCTRATWRETRPRLLPHPSLHAAWQEQQLRRLAPQTIIFIDEPYLASLGSAYVSISAELVQRLLAEVCGGVSGLVGLHCCGNTDWPVLLAAPIDILNFDAYNYADTLTLYPADVRAFIDRGGRLAWGIVPVASDEAVLNANAEDLVRRLEAAIDQLAARGVAREQLTAGALLTPACGMGTLSEHGATRALELLAEVSNRLRAIYA